MGKAFFIRNSSAESEDVKSLLINFGIEFIEVYSLSQNERPVVFINQNYFPLTGIDAIESYFNFYNNNKLSNKDHLITSEY